MNSRLGRLSMRSLSLTPFLVLAMLVLAREAAAQVEFLRGDVNQDGRVSLSDGMMAQRFLFQGGWIDCMNAVDADDNGHLNISDSVRILGYVLGNRPAPPSPFPGLGADPTPNLPVEGQFGTLADCNAYEVTKPLPSDDAVQIGVVTGSPGAEIEVPVYIDSAVDVEGFQLILEYDPALFAPTEGTGVGKYGWNVPPFAFSSTYYEGVFEDSDSSSPAFAFAGLTAYPDDGVIVAGFIPDILLSEHSLPPHTSAIAFKLRGRIPETAPAGASMEIRAVDPASGGYGIAGLRSELTHQGDARLVSIEPRVFPGRLEIVGDLIFFRGDSNDDQRIDISDAEFTLMYLFAAGASPICLDALDANDDGKLNISDPVATLMYLFLGGPAPPPPFATRGLDPTPDALRCGGDAT